MTVLRSIESKLERLFEGAFGRAFRSNVQPVEIARKLVKEMDDNRTVSVSRIYVPNEYVVYLAPQDRSQFTNYERSLCDELQEYLTAHARRERYVLPTPPRVSLESDADLGIGLFGIAAKLVQPEAQDFQPAPVAVAAAAAAPETALPETALPGSTMIYTPPPAAAAAAAPEPEPEPVATLSFSGSKHQIKKGRATLGRSRECDIRVPDPNASRRHAEVVHDGNEWALIDLGSTNGTQSGGRSITRLTLRNGTTFTIGATDIVFSDGAGS